MPRTKKASRDIYQEVTDKIVEALEAGTAPWIRPWSTEGTNSGFLMGGGYTPRNGSSGRFYNGVNVLLLWITGASKGYESNEWFTYKQAAAMNGQVRKGEKSTMVTLWKPLHITETNDATGEREKKKILLMRGYNVFNREQIDGLPESKYAPKPTEADETEDAPTVEEVLAEREGRIEAYIAATSADIREEEQQGRAFYSLIGDYIGMPSIERFKDTGAYYSTILHELTHWTGKADRCERDFANRFGTEAYAMEELVAELGAAFLCATFGVEGTLQHDAYIASWIKVLKADKRAIITAASKAKKAVAFLDEFSAEEADAEEMEAASAAS